MKRLLLCLVVALPCFAAGVVQQNSQELSFGNVKAITFNWTGDATTGSVPITLARPNFNMQGLRVLATEVTPGTPNPTNGYSITLPDSAGVDLLAGGGTSLSSSLSVSINGATSAPPIFGSFSLSITGQNVAGATGIVTVYMAPIQQFLGLSLNLSGAGGGITQLFGDGIAGPGTGSQGLTLSTVNANVGTFGDTSHIPVITVNAKGLVTAVSLASNSGGAGLPCTTTALSFQFNNGGVFGCVPDITQSALHTTTLGAAAIWNMSAMPPSSILFPSGFFQAGGFNLAAQVPVNFTASGSGGGLTFAVSNPGAGTVQYSLTGSVTLAGMATQASSTMVANVSGGTASPTAVAIPQSAPLIGTGTNGAPALASPFQTNPQISTYLVTATDFANYATITVASGTFTITLPASAPPTGQSIRILNYGSGTVTVNPNSLNMNGSAVNQTIAAGSAAAPNGMLITSNAAAYFQQPISGTAGGGSGTVSSCGTAGSVAYYAASGTVVSCPGGNLVLTAGGLFTAYDGLTTAGTGLPVIVAHVVLTNSSATNLVNLLASAPAGHYQIVYNIDMHTPCTAGSVPFTLVFGWTGNSARSLQTGVATFGLAQTTTSYLSGVQPIEVGSITNVTYTPSLSGNTCQTGTATWDGYISLWRMN